MVIKVVEGVLSMKVLSYLNKLQLLSKNFVIWSLISLIALSACSNQSKFDAEKEQAVEYNEISASSSVKANAHETIGPNGTITSPVNNVTISAGEIVSFTAVGTNPNGGALSYLWNFGNIQSASTAQNPGSISITEPGTYIVTLTVSNSLGIADPTPDARIITVNPVSLLPVVLPPTATINAPIGDLTINSGESIYFAGTGSSPQGNSLLNLNYLWNFDGAAPNSILETPGNITFSQPGSYLVSFFVSDPAGIWSHPALVNVTVNDISAQNLAPTGFIVQPSSDMNIKVGESVYFAGFANDVDGNAPLSYFWNFSGAAVDSALETPGNIMFSRPGTYMVNFTVIDALGSTDPNPPMRIITVADVAVRQDAPLTNVIVSPASDMVVNVGESITFQGESAGGDVVGPLRYLWQVDDDMNLFTPEQSVMQSPGDIVFEQEGEYEVELMIADATGNIISQEVEREIRVVDPNALIANVIEPPTDLTINLGEAVFFDAIVSDPQGGLDFNFMWTFDGAAPDAMVATPGDIVFNTLGKFEVRLRVSDLNGRMARSVSRTIMVVDPAALQARIINPMMGVTITAGQTLNFISEVIDPFVSPTLEVVWNLDGAAPDIMALQTGNVVFANAGRYDISFVAIDRDPITGQVLRSSTSNSIKVKVLGADEIQANIANPTHDMLLFLGESVDFVGEALDPTGDASNLEYRWDFEDFAPPVTGLSTGPILFDQAGEFEVELRVFDSVTSRRSNEVEREIYVAPVAGPTSAIAAIKGFITSPVGDLVIPAGSSVNFQSAATSHLGIGGISYFWSFDGILPNMLVQNPGNIVFPTPGVYTIVLTVISENGEIDPAPPSVTITVL